MSADATSWLGGDSGSPFVTEGGSTCFVIISLSGTNLFSCPYVYAHTSLDSTLLRTQLMTLAILDISKTAISMTPTQSCGKKRTREDSEDYKAQPSDATPSVPATRKANIDKSTTMSVRDMETYKLALQMAELQKEFDKRVGEEESLWWKSFQDDLREQNRVLRDQRNIIKQEKIKNTEQKIHETRWWAWGKLPRDENNIVSDESLDLATLVMNSSFLRYEQVKPSYPFIRTCTPTGDYMSESGDIRHATCILTLSMLVPDAETMVRKMWDKLHNEDPKKIQQVMDQQINTDIVRTACPVDRHRWSSEWVLYPEGVQKWASGTHSVDNDWCAEGMDNLKLYEFLRVLFKLEVKLCVEQLTHCKSNLLSIWNRRVELVENPCGVASYTTSIFLYLPCSLAKESHIAL